MITTAQLARAQSVADEFNTLAGFDLLKVVAPAPSLSWERLQHVLAVAGSGWFMTSSIWSIAWKRAPTHGEAILAGKWLAARGLQRKKSGPTTLWLLDESVLQGAD